MPGLLGSAVGGQNDQSVLEGNLSCPSLLIDLKLLKIMQKDTKGITVYNCQILVPYSFI
jgi:hypothetical protein